MSCDNNELWNEWQINTMTQNCDKYIRNEWHRKIPMWKWKKKLNKIKANAVNKRRDEDIICKNILEQINYKYMIANESRRAMPLSSDPEARERKRKKRLVLQDSQQPWANRRHSHGQVPYWECSTLSNTREAIVHSFWSLFDHVILVGRKKHTRHCPPWQWFLQGAHLLQGCI